MGYLALFWHGYAKQQLDSQAAADKGGKSKGLKKKGDPGAAAGGDSCTAKEGVTQSAARPKMQQDKQAWEKDSDEEEVAATQHFFNLFAAFALRRKITLYCTCIVAHSVSGTQIGVLL